MCNIIIGVGGMIYKNISLTYAKQTETWVNKQMNRELHYFIIIFTIDVTHLFCILLILTYAKSL